MQKQPQQQNHHMVDKKILGSKKGFIFGPFIGDLYWEAFRFAPYAISLKKRFPYHHLIVFTRPRSFDLYGHYASVLVPLVIKEGMYVEDCFKLKAYDVKEYKGLCRYIRKVYSNLYDITDHYTPQIQNFMYKVKWQYPRKYMEYDFVPRKKNQGIINEVYGELDNIVLTTRSDIKMDNYNVIQMKDFLNDIDKFINSSQCSWVGCLLIMLKKCKFVISNFDDNLAKFSLLVNTPVITEKETYSDDAIYLLNPLKTSYIKCENYKEGVEKYENNIRS